MYSSLQTYIHPCAYASEPNQQHLCCLRLKHTLYMKCNVKCTEHFRDDNPENKCFELCRKILQLKCNSQKISLE